MVAAVLPILRVRGGSGEMAGDNRRPEHRICNNTDEQEDRNHDRRSKLFHGLSFVRRTGSVVPVGVISRGFQRTDAGAPERGRCRAFQRQDLAYRGRRLHSCQATNRQDRHSAAIRSAAGNGSYRG